MTLLAIDPGKTIGWSLWYETGVEVARGVFQYEDILERFTITPSGLLYFAFPWPEIGERFEQVTRLAIEDYIGRPGAKNGGQHFWGPESLAKIELLGELAGIEAVRQRAVDVIKVSALQAGYVLPKGHLPDQDSAYLHGRYRLTQLGVLRAEPLAS